MNTEERKIYNKKYYETNKSKIISKALTKITCEFCGRSVINNNINKHQKSSICKRKTEQNKETLKRFEEMKMFYEPCLRGITDCPIQ